MDLLRENLVVDLHVKLSKPEASLFGYDLIACEPKGDSYSADFFLNHTLIHE